MEIPLSDDNDPLKFLELTDLRHKICDCAKGLSERNRSIVISSLFFSASNADLSLINNISSSRVRQIIKKFKEDLRITLNEVS